MAYQYRPKEKQSLTKFIIPLVIILLLAILLLYLNLNPKITGKAYQRPDVGIKILNLNNYPNIFTENGNFKATIIYDIGAVNAVNLLDSSLSKILNECKKIFSHEKTKDIPITTQLSSEFGTRLTDSDLDGFQRQEIRLSSNNSNEYTLHDELRFADDADLAPHTTLTFNSNDRFEDRVLIPLPRESIGYYVVFESQLESGDRITSATAADPVTFNFLGKELRIDSATSNSITTNVGNKFQLSAGDSVSIEGRDLTLIHTTTNKAKISVDGLIEVIDADTTQRVNGIEIRVEDVSDDEGIEYDSATLYVGEQARKTYKTGTAFIGEDTSNPTWEWDLENLNTASPTIGIVLAEEIDSPSESGLMEHPLYEGESLCLPNDYACIEFKELLVNDYKNYEINTQTKELYASLSDANNGVVEVSGARVLVFRSSGNSFKVNGEDSEEIYMYSTGAALKLYRKLPSNSKAVYFADSSSNAFQLDYKDTNIQVTVNWDAAADTGDITLELNSDIVIYFEAAGTNKDTITYLGHSDGASTVTDDIQVGSVDISTYENNIRVREGIIIEDPESHSSSDKISLRAPSDTEDFKALVAVKTSSITDNQCSINEVSLQKSRVFTNDKSLILIGTDTLADAYLSNELLGIYNQNKAIISLVEKDGVKALLILGHTEADINEAVDVVVNSKLYDLNTEVFVL